MAQHPAPTPLPNLEVIAIPGEGPEDVLPDRQGGTVFGLSDGRILRRDPDGDTHILAQTNGRPLGLDWLPDNRLLICDAERGLLALTPSTKDLDVICDTVVGDPLVLCNNAAVGADGTIWFTDSSTRYGLPNVTRDMVEDTRSGRLLRLAPGGTPEIAMDGLGFANGVTILQGTEGDRVLVAATGEAAIHGLWISGKRAGEREVFAKDLPLMPDNLSLGTNGLIWAGGPSRWERSLALVWRLPHPIRRMIGKVAQRSGAKARPIVGVMAFDRTGRMVHRFEDSHIAFQNVTGARELDGTVWLGSLDSPAIARFKV
ncbi:MAG: SMP-30/gluconolactonase/LRE family protein [Pseudomonadota bacterium]